MRCERMLPLLLAAGFFSGCAGTKEDAAAADASPFGPTGIPPHLRANRDGEGTPVAPGGNVPAAALTNHDPNELVWTDPDDADAEIPELQGLMAVAPRKSPWRESESEALREAKQSGKPLLIWFTDSARSTACKSLSAGLLATSEFEAWASDNTVRLIVDQSVKGKDIDDDARKKIYVRNLKKKYNARGYPTLMVLAPSGEVIGRYTGYRKGKEDFLLGQIKQGVQLANERQKAWKSSLKRKGYREWSDGKGREIFAKLAAYDDGELILVEPDGQRARTHEKHLSAGDRVWIQQQKELRGMR